MSQHRSLTAKKSHSKEISQQRSLTAKKFHSKEVSQQRNLNVFERSLARKLRFHKLRFHKLCFNIFNAHFLGRLARKLRFHIFNIYFLRDVSHESSASFSHLELSLFEGRLARKLRFTSSIFSF